MSYILHLMSMNIIKTPEEAIELLKSGKTLIFPTETSYGLGCDATNQKAVDQIFKIKGRPDNKPLLVVVPTVEMAKEYLEWTPLLEKISKKYWPGSLTVVGLLKSKKSQKNENVLKKIKPLAKGVVSKFGTVAVRVTRAEVPNYLSKELGHPVVATSANVAGLGDLYYSTDVLNMFEERKVKPEGFLDAGILPKNLPTTIISVVNNKVEVLREGEVKVHLVK